MFCEFSNPFISTAQFHWPNHPLTLNGSRDHGYSSAHALPDNPQLRTEASPGNPLLLGDLRHNLRDSSSLLFPTQHQLAHGRTRVGFARNPRRNHRGLFSNHQASRKPGEEIVIRQIFQRDLEEPRRVEPWYFQTHRSLRPSRCQWPHDYQRF